MFVSLYRLITSTSRSLQGVLELHGEYDITWGDAFQIMRWKPDPNFEADTPADPHEMAFARQRHRRLQRAR